MSVEEIAQRFSSRDGLKLRDYIEVSLPVYRIRLRAITVARKSIPPVEEFILRSLLLEIRSLNSISAFLGLEERVLKPALVSLIESGDVVAAPSTGEGEFHLTQKGRITAERQVMISTEERTFPIYFDALTRKPAWYRSEQLIEYRETKTRGLREIAAHPSVRPKVGDLRITEIDSIVKSMQLSSDVRRDLVAIRGIEACRKWFLPALALFYSRDGIADIQVGIVVGGRSSPAHERVVVSLPDFSEFIAAAVPVKQEVETELMLAQKSNPEFLMQSDDLDTKIASAQIKKGQVEELLVQSDSAQDQALKAKVLALEDEIARLSKEAKSLPVRNLYVQDHPPLLLDALKSSTERLLIISPWIKADVVDQAFLNDLERLLRAGVQIYIGHGITPSPTKNARQQDIAAKSAIESLAGLYKNISFVRLGNTHAKVLIKDHEFAAVTSFNWLSFRGDPARTYRDEQGVLFQRSDLVDDKFSEVVKQFSKVMPNQP